MNIYLDLFNTLIHDQKKHFVLAMIEVIEHYATSDSLKNSPIEYKIKRQQALQNFYDYLNKIVNMRHIDKEIGSIFFFKFLVENPVNFKQDKVNMPSDFIEVMEAGKKLELKALIEKSKADSCSPLVAQCENKAASEMFSPEVIFAQTSILERALKNKEVTLPGHIREIENKIQEWNTLLFTKFAEMILMSENLGNLNKSVEENFSKSEINDLPGSKIAVFENEVQCQIEFLEKEGFFKNYYAESNMADKYDYVFNFNSQLKEKRKIEPELRATLNGLVETIENQSYQPIEAEKFRLMDLPTGTVNKVFEELRSCLSKNYDSFKETDLYDALLLKVNEDEKKFKLWEEASHRILDKPETYRTYQPLMRNLFMMKYAGDPNQDPKDLLRSLPKPVAPSSPVKRKVLTPAPYVPSLPSVSNANQNLTTDEVLSLDNDLSEVDESQNKKKIKRI